MKLTAAVTAGMVLRPVARADALRPARDLCEGVECPVPFEVGGDLFVQRLRSGDSILGPVLIYQWDVFSDSGPYRMIAKLVRPDHQIVLMRASLLPCSNYMWKATPAAEITVLPRGEVVFKCSSPGGEGAVRFEKLT